MSPGDIRGSALSSVHSACLLRCRAPAALGRLERGFPAGIGLDQQAATGQLGECLVKRLVV
jgi:hypothetical protein